MKVLNTPGIKSSKIIFQGVPLILWGVIIASLFIPFLTDFLLPETPMVIYLLFLFPIIIFAFYMERKKMLLWVLIFSICHSLWGIFFQFQIGGIEDVDIRIYNHLGFTIVSFFFAILLCRLLKEMKESDFRYKSVVENSPQLILLHQDGIIIFANPTALELAGVNNRSELIGKSIFDFVHPLSKEKLLHRIKKVDLNERGKDFIEYKFVRPDGKCLYLELLGSVINYKGKPSVLVIGKDVTSQKEYQEKIEYMAFHDSLTGLPNRYFLDKYLEEALNDCEENHKKLSLMFIDLDRFKFINDTMGHKLGDSLLVQVSERLRQNVREGDVVARQGGDEFLILLKDIESSEVERVADGIITSFTIPFKVEEEEFYTTPSIGISLFPKDGKDKETLTKHADTAMYMAKKRGKNNFQFYSDENEEIRIRNIKLEQALKRAIMNNEFQIHYQPKVELKTGKIFGVEALLRWKQSELGNIPPTEFIPIAEEIGMIIPIGEWVLQEACKQNREWQKSGVEMNVAVNVSTIQFEDPNFVDIVKAALSKCQLSPEYLILEITESVMQNIKNSSSIIHTLKNLGVKIAIDDFGTGYSSLSVLNKLPIDLVKIDKSFVSEITTNLNTASLIVTMIEIGQNLQFDLVAEGIENEQQADFLTQNDCRFGQGYLYSPPLSAQEIENILKKNFKEL